VTTTLSASLRSDLMPLLLSRLYLRSLASQSDIDEAEVKAMLQDRHHYLVKAIIHYATCLKISSAHDFKIFRLVSLWFENEADPSVSNLIEVKRKPVLARHFGKID